MGAFLVRRWKGLQRFVEVTVELELELEMEWDSKQRSNEDKVEINLSRVFRKEVECGSKVEIGEDEEERK